VPKAPHNIPQDVLESIVKNYNPNGLNVLKELAVEMGERADALAREAGYPEELIQIMQARRARPSYREMARSFFAIEPMPEGAKPIYSTEVDEPTDQ